MLGQDNEKLRRGKHVTVNRTTMNYQPVEQALDPTCRRSGLGPLLPRGGESRRPMRVCIEPCPAGCPST